MKDLMQMLRRCCKIFIALLLVVTLFGCKKSRKPKLEGHWISIDYFEGKRFFTIDFREVKEKTNAGHDTVVQYIEINKNSLNSYQGWATNLVEENGVYYFYIGHGEEHTLILVGDTLVANGDYFKGKLARIENESSKYDELFSESGFAVKLTATNTKNCENIETRLLSHVFVGKPMESDSVSINVNDVFIRLNEIPQFVREEKMKLIDEDRNDLVVIIVSDSTISQRFLDQVVQEIKKESPIKIRRAFYNYQNQQICFEKMEK